MPISFTFRTLFDSPNAENRWPLPACSMTLVSVPICKTEWAVALYQWVDTRAGNQRRVCYLSCMSYSIRKFQWKGSCSDTNWSMVSYNFWVPIALLTIAPGLSTLWHDLSTATSLSTQNKGKPILMTQNWLPEHISPATQVIWNIYRLLATQQKYIFLVIFHHVNSSNGKVEKHLCSS